MDRKISHINNTLLMNIVLFRDVVKGKILVTTIDISQIYLEASLSTVIYISLQRIISVIFLSYYVPEVIL